LQVGGRGPNFCGMTEPLSIAKHKMLRSLTTSKGRTRENAFLAEGVRIVQEGLAQGLQPIAVVFEAEALDEREELRSLARKAGDAARVAEARDFADLSETVHSQGVVAAFAKQSADPRALLSQSTCTFLVADNMRDPGNLGTLMRHAAAFDCTGLFLLKGCCDPWNSKAVRASMGGIFSMPVETDCQPGELLALFEEQGIWPYVLENKPGAQPALSVEYAPRSVFVIGGETEGVGDYWQESAVIRVKIAQTERVESLNASVAAAIMMSHRYQMMVR